MNIFNLYEKDLDLDFAKGYKELTQDFIEEATNGCGSKSTAWFVPETPLGLDLRPACVIHDLDYHFIIEGLKIGCYPRTYAKKLQTQADKRFRRNIKKLAKIKYKENSKGVFSLAFWRSEEGQAKLRLKEHYKIAKIYYEGVKLCGWEVIEEGLKS